MSIRLHDLVQKLVASDNPSEAYTTFSGVTRLRQGISPQNVFVDRNEEDGGLARAATLGRLSSLRFVCLIFPRISTCAISRGTWLGSATCCHPLPYKDHTQCSEQCSRSSHGRERRRRRITVASR
jgi:hypothetical protein